jgi:hypothetical protein
MMFKHRKLRNLDQHTLLYCLQNQGEGSQLNELYTEHTYVSEMTSDKKSDQVVEYKCTPLIHLVRSDLGLNVKKTIIKSCLKAK